jgi:hypothetical protein
MRVLLDTNIVIHREARSVKNASIGTLFRWLDKLHHEKCVHPSSIEEIGKHFDKDLVASFQRKLDSYSALRTVAPDHPSISELRSRLDRTENDKIDTTLLNELIQGRVDALISEDRGVMKKARLLGVDTQVFTIDAYLEKVTAENPSLVDYKILSVRQEYFGNINVKDDFFDSFRRDYPGFDSWFARKSDEIAYVCRSETNAVIGFLYIKKEDENENYSDISPPFDRRKRLKIGTFKVVANGHKIGERFLKIIFDNSLLQGCNETYVTLYQNTDDQVRLKSLLMEWGFVEYGQKRSGMELETVLVRAFSSAVNSDDPKVTYLFLRKTARKFIVPIYPDYHTELLPDSILRTESPADFLDSKPNRNAISKVYISRSLNRDLSRGDIIVFYRTASGGAGYHTSVATSLGVVEEVHNPVTSKDELIRLCRKRSVFSDADLAAHWDWNRNLRPFVVNFLYVATFPHRLNLKALIENGIIKEAPRGFERIGDREFDLLCRLSKIQLSYTGN